MSGSGFATLGGLIGGLARPGRSTNEGGSIYGGQRNVWKDMLEGAGTAGDEEFASSAKKAKALRAYFAESQPELKDKVQAMSLTDLEGHAMQYAEQQRKQEEDLKRQMLAEQIQSMQAARAARAQQVQANQAFSRYATAPATQERWQQSLANGPTADGADMLNSPLRSPTSDEARAAYFRAAATGTAPDTAGMSMFIPRPEGPLDRFKAETDRQNAIVGARQVDARMQENRGQANPAATKERLIRVETVDPVTKQKVVRMLTQEEYAASEAKGQQDTIGPQLAEARAELARHEAEMSSGDNRYGFMNLSNRKARVAELKAKIAEWEKQMGGGKTANNDPLGLGL